MNKLYVVKFTIRGHVIGVKNFWNQDDAVAYMNSCGDDAWNFELIENNDVHKIWIGR